MTSKDVRILPSKVSVQINTSERSLRLEIYHSVNFRYLCHLFYFFIPLAHVKWLHCPLLDLSENSDPAYTLLCSCAASSSRRRLHPCPCARRLFLLLPSVSQIQFCQNKKKTTKLKEITLKLYPPKGKYQWVGTCLQLVYKSVNKLMGLP